MRGSESQVVCDSCGRRVPRSKGIVYEKMVKYGTEPNSLSNVRFMTKRKVYYCISCAKHRGIFEKKAREAERHSANKFE
jgi:ribosomal protein S26